MLQIFEQVRDVCQQRRECYARGEAKEINNEEEEKEKEEETHVNHNTTYSTNINNTSLTVLLRRLRLSAMMGFKFVASSRSLRPKPFLFPTPDGALRSATSPHRRVQAPAPPLASEKIILTTDGPQEYHREKHSSSMVVPTPAGIRTTGDRNKETEKEKKEEKEEEKESVDSCTRAAVGRGLVAVLISVCSSTTVDGEEEASDVFSLQERVEALHALVAVMCYACGVRGDGGSLICKIDLLQLSATACDILKRVVEQVMCDGQEKNTTGDERRELVETFTSISNTIVMLLGCRDPRHWERDHEEVEKEEEEKTEKLDSLNHACSQSMNFWHRFTSEENSGIGGCLCCGAGPLSYQFMMTALTENGLWQYMWRFVAFPFLAQSSQEKNGIKQQSQKQQQYGNVDNDDNNKYDNEIVVEDTGSDFIQYCNTVRIIGVRLTLKMMTLLLLRGSVTGEHDLASILCCPTVQEEEELETMWSKTLTPFRRENQSHHELSTNEKRIIFTLQQLSGFLVFRRFSCYAANAMHVLLTRLHPQLPPIPDINMRVVFEALFFLQEPLPISIINPISDSTSSEEKHDNEEENTIPCMSQTTTDITASVILGRLLHVLSFHLEFSRDEWSETIKKKHSDRYTGSTTAPTTSHALCLAGALLSIVLLLDQQQEKEEKQKEECNSVFSLEQAMGRHPTYKACEHALLLPAAVSAGLSRTHQVLLLLRTIATMHIQTPVHTQTRHHSYHTHTNSTIDINTFPCIHTLRLAGPYIVAFSQLVRPNAPTPPSLRWRQLTSDVWAETITATVRGTAAISTAERRRKSLTSLSCTLTCPLRPMYLEEHDSLHKNGRKGEKEEEYNEGEEEKKNQRQEESDKIHVGDVLQPLQVYVKVPRAEGGEQAGSVNNTGVNNDNSTGVSSKTDPILPEESFPPMFFGYESVSFSNRNKRSGGVVAGIRSHNSHSVGVGFPSAVSGSASNGGVVSVNGNMKSMISLPLKQIPCEIKTLFVNMDGEEYTRIIHNIPSFSSLNREKVEYVATVEMTIISPSQKSSEDNSEEYIWPFNMVIIACCTVYGDELYLYSQPPQRSMVLLCEEGDKNISQRLNKNEPMGQGRKKQSHSKVKQGNAVYSKNLKLVPNTICSVSRFESSNTITAQSSSPQDDNTLQRQININERGTFSSHKNNKQDIVNNNASENKEDPLSSYENEYDKMNDIDAYIAALEPTAVVDIALTRKDHEIQSLQKQLQQVRESESALQHQLQDVLTQRETLVASLTDTRAELRLWHTDVVAPLRREVTLLRRSLVRRNAETRAAVSLCRALRDEHISLTLTIHTLREEVRSLMEVMEESRGET